MVQTNIGNEDNLMNITQENELDFSSGSDRAAETKRFIYVTTFPFLIIFRSIGNLLTFVVMRRGSMKHVSTCFYMAILALANTGKSYSCLGGQSMQISLLIQKLPLVYRCFYYDSCQCNYIQLG